MNETYKFPKDSTLTRTEIEQQIRNINTMLTLYDRLIKFLWEYMDKSIHIKDCVNLTQDIDFEDTLEKTKSELEIL